MTKHRGLLALVASAAALFGLTAVAGAAYFNDLAGLYRLSALVSGGCLVAGAWLIWKLRYSGVVLLWLSAALYVLAQVVPAMQRHGGEAFAALLWAFYISAGIRLALAAAGHYLVRERHG